MKSSAHGLLAQVALAHSVSHLHIMAVPALLPILPGMLQVSFVELGVAIGLFNIVSALVQAPLGFMVDRVGARRMLMAALLLGACSFALLALFPSYLMLLLVMMLAGLANGVYHPADYSLLSRGMPPARMGRAFSLHSFAGFFGAALAPPIFLGLALLANPRWSFALAAAAGFIALTVMLCWRVRLLERPAETVAAADARPAPVRPLRTPVMVLAVLTLLFTLISLSTGGIEKFSVSALVQGFGVSLHTANLALTSFLFASAFGVLAGGLLADHTSRHGHVAATAFGLAALLMLLVAGVTLPPALLVMVFGLTGLFTGMVAPSRDMLVRAASPAGAEGRTFGIVSTGFNVGGVIGPLLFGALLDHAWASSVLWAAAGFMGLTTVVVLLQERHRQRHSAALQSADAGA